MPIEKSLFAVNLTWLRNQRRLTRKRAAELSGIPISNWSSYEEGRAKPVVDKLPKICQTLEFYDVIAMITTDLASQSSQLVPKSEAMDSLSKLNRYLEQLKN